MSTETGPRRRYALVERATKESDVRVELDLDGTGEATSDTGVGFFDHMVNQLGRHAGFDLHVVTKGDTDIDSHHTVEDTALAIGTALREALGDKAGIRRFGDALVPLDECLVQVAVDLSGRPYCVHTEPGGLAPMIGTYDTSLTRHVWESITATAQIALHVNVMSGRNAHHVAEAQFKAVARALRDATAYDPKVVGVPSTKGTLQVGAFYDSLAARAPRDQVVATAGTAWSAALVGPTRQGWTVVAPDSDGRLDDHLAEAAVALSAHGPVLCTTVHDDDDLLLQAYVSGELVATYDSSPGYLTDEDLPPDVGELDALAQALGVHDVTPLREVLTGRYATETERLADAAPLLGLPPYVVLFGYDYAVDGDLPTGLGPEDLQAVGAP